jgi:hypothetical protein
MVNNGHSKTTTDQERNALTRLGRGHAELPNSSTRRCPWSCDLRDSLASPWAGRRGHAPPPRTEAVGGIIGWVSGHGLMRRSSLHARSRTGVRRSPHRQCRVPVPWAGSGNSPLPGFGSEGRRHRSQRESDSGVGESMPRGVIRRLACRPRPEPPGSAGARTPVHGVRYMASGSLSECSGTTSRGLQVR